MKNTVKNIGYLLLPVIIYAVLCAFHGRMQYLTNTRYLPIFTIIDDVLTAIVFALHAYFVFRGSRGGNRQTVLFLFLGAVLGLAAYYVVMFAPIPADMNRMIGMFSYDALYCFIGVGVNAAAAIGLLIDRKRATKTVD